VKTSKFSRLPIYITLAFIILIFLMTSFIIGPKFLCYRRAIRMQEAGDVIGAYKSFRSLSGIWDSTQRANSLYETYKSVLIKNAQPGDMVIFGFYEQNNQEHDGAEEIYWQVLERNGDDVLLLCCDVLDCVPYQNNREEITWEECSLRKWLNEEFLNLAFSPEEQARIVPVVNDSTNVADHSFEDAVFVLSKEEAALHFPAELLRECKPTEYARARGCSVMLVPASKAAGWWLRELGEATANYAYVDGTGDFQVWFGLQDYDVGVRPAVWISTD